MSFPRPSPQEMQDMDGPLVALAQQSNGDLRKLLYAFFSFLHRRTDFYAVPDEGDLKSDGKAPFGFRQGDAEKLLLAAFRQFPLRKIPPRSHAQKVPPATAGMNARKNETSTPGSVSKSSTTPINSSSNTQSTPRSVAKSEKEELSEPLAKVRLTDDGLQVPVGNGGSTETYKWTQSIEESSVLISIPERIRGKDLHVTIKPSKISVCTKQPMPGESEARVFLDGSLTEKIVPDESTWTLEGGVLVLVLYKLKKSFWKALLEGDPEIDTSLVDSRRHIGEYDEATQAQIRKIMFDQSQARKGLPSSASSSPSNSDPNASIQVPPLPPGVEFIDQNVLNEHDKSNREKL